VLAGRERRLKHERDHLISRRIVGRLPERLDWPGRLTHILERTKRRHSKKASQKQHKANGHAAKRAFAELQGYPAYKARLAGDMAVTVDAYQTSKACPRCGYTAEDNRPEQWLLFACQACHLTLHADLVGARNVALRTLLARHDQMRTGI